MRTALRNFTPVQAAFDGHGFAGRTAESVATATSLSLAPTSPWGKGHPRQGDHPSGSGLHVWNTHSKTTVAPGHSWLEAEQGEGGRGRCIRMPFLSLEEGEDGRNEVLILHICTFHLSHKGPWERGRLPTPLMLGSSPGQGWWEGNQLTQVGAKTPHSYVEPSVLCCA